MIGDDIKFGELMGDLVLVEMAPSVSDLIHLPPDVSKWHSKENAIQGFNRGTILKVGPGKKHEKTGILLETTVQPGDVIRFSDLQYPEYRQDGKRCCLIHEGDILFVEEEATA